MKKIPTMFERDEKTHRVTPTVKPECAWVLAGEGVATKKWDGTCCAVIGGKLFKRYDGSKSKYLPPDFVPCDNADSHWHGWRPVGEGPEDRWHKTAWDALTAPLADGTYELIGPKVNQNPDRAEAHRFQRHGNTTYLHVPRDFDGLAAYLKDLDAEGIVFHHPDGRMAKIKGRDFGHKRPAVPAAA